MGERWTIGHNGIRRPVQGTTMTDRELEVARRVVSDGEPTTRAVAEAMGLTEYAARDLVKRVYHRTGAHTRLALYKFMVRNELL